MEAGELVDLNGDGKLDFLPNTGNVVVWYELTQQKPKVVWTKHDLGKIGAGHADLRQHLRGLGCAPRLRRRQNQ
jgi:hypothetical protein